MAIVPPFDTSRHFLGTLCKRSHDWHGTGHSLRQIHNRDCVECQKWRGAMRSDRGRRRLNGDTTHPKNDAVQHREDGSSLIPLGRDMWAIVDTADVPILLPFSWYVPGRSRRQLYPMACMQKKSVRMSRFLLEPPDDMLVDHINRDTLDNRRCNLRVVTPSQNLANMAPHRDSKSGFKGVHFHTSSGLWTARICVDYKIVRLGYFHDPIEAARAYDTKARELFGDYARVNFPDRD